MRFDYVKYDEQSVREQTSAKEMCEKLEVMINGLGQGRAQSLALTKLEEVYMWIGKAIRDNQVARASQVDDVPERSNN